MGIKSIFGVNIQKLFIQGKIDRVYEKMYRVAEEIAVHEMKNRLELFSDKVKKSSDKKGSNYWEEYLDAMIKYKEKRIQYHMNEMKELLLLKKDTK